MTDDIVTRLRHVSWLAEEGSEVVDLAATAADEIERLRTALALACGLLSTYEDHSMFEPDQLMQQFLKKADRG